MFVLLDRHGKVLAEQTRLENTDTSEFELDESTFATKKKMLQVKRKKIDQSKTGTR